MHLHFLNAIFMSFQFAPRLRDPATVPESPADLDPRPKQSPLKMSATGLKFLGIANAFMF